MIDKIKIKNFLSHKDTTIDLSPGVNIIVGVTDSGKSAIIRALKWILTNRPTGDSFRSYWGGDTSVSIEMGKNKVTRVKTDKRNGYTINGADFDAIGSEVPADIIEVLNMNEVNLQTQFESHFLLSKSSGEVSSYFNKIAHLYKIDLGLQNINKWIRRIQDSIKSDESEVEILTEQLQEYENIEEIENLVNQLESIQEDRITRADDKARIYELISAISTIETDIEDLEEILPMESILNEIIGTQEESVRLLNINKTIQRLINEINAVDLEIEEFEEILPMESMLIEIIDIQNELEEKHTQVKDLEKIIIHINELDERIEQGDEFIEEHSKELHSQLKDGVECPECGSIIKE